jgi:hypothetical protein
MEGSIQWGGKKLPGNWDSGKFNPPATLHEPMPVPARWNSHRPKQLSSGSRAQAELGR